MASHRLSETYRQNRSENAPSRVKSKQNAQTRPQVADSTEDDERQRLLRQFDLTAKYGPCTNITRKQRWERASQLGLDPPQNVLQVLQQLDENHQEQQGLWVDRT